MDVTATQTAYQPWRLPAPPAALLLFHEAKMLSTRGQHGGEALLQSLADLSRIDVGNGSCKVDARAPGVEGGEPRQTRQMLAVAVRGRAREPPAVASPHRRPLSGRDKTRAHA